MSFFALTLADLKLALPLLLDAHAKAHRALKPTSAGAIYLPLLAEQRASLDALPVAFVESTRPLADELNAADVLHDGYGSAFWFMVEAYVRAPSTPADLRKALKHLRDVLLPELRLLKASFADEAANAHDNQSKLVAVKSALKQIPLAPSGTLYDWVEGFVSAGVTLDALLQQRSELPESDRSAATSLRTGSIALLNSLRETLAHEFKGKDALATLDHTVFAHLDTLEAARRSHSSGGSEEPADPATPATTKPADGK